MFRDMAKKQTKKTKPVDEGALTERFMVRCSPAQMRAYEARANALGLRRGPHDTGVGMLARKLLDADAKTPANLVAMIDAHAAGGAS